jgi:hypothetical protein
VLKEVSHTGTANSFVFRTYVVHYGNRGYWSAVIFVQNDVQTIAECVLFKANILCVGLINEQTRKRHKDKFTDFHGEKLWRPN